MLVKFIGGYAHGRTRFIEDDLRAYTFSKCLAERIEESGDLHYYTQREDYELVYYNKNFKCEPLKHNGKYFMIKKGMHPDDSKIIQKVLWENEICF